MGNAVALGQRRLTARGLASADPSAKRLAMMKATANWIDSYVGTGLSAKDIADKLTLSGTEVEKQEAVGGDVCFTLEVTSNRTDCLSVIGLARELAACTGRVVKHPKVEYKTKG